LISIKAMGALITCKKAAELCVDHKMVDETAAQGSKRGIVLERSADDQKTFHGFQKIVVRTYDPIVKISKNCTPFRINETPCNDTDGAAPAQPILFC